MFRHLCFIIFCEGLFASGQNAETFVMPALIPVADDLFCSRTSSDPASELETQREVMLTMLIKLLPYSQVRLSVEKCGHALDCLTEQSRDQIFQIRYQLTIWIKDIQSFRLSKFEYWIFYAKTTKSLMACNLAAH